MAKLVQQSTSADPLFFFLTASSDHISGLTGKAGTVSVEISKNGAAGGAPSGAISEIDATNMPGWYAIAGNATDTNTLGELLLHAAVAAADPCDMIVAQVVAFNPRDPNLGLSNVSANVMQINSSAVAAQNVSKANQAIGRGTCAGTGGTTFVATSAFTPGGAGILPSQFVGRTIVFDATTTTPSLQGQATNIIANTGGATPTFTVTALTTVPVAGDTFGVY